jgi:hypothetical protein
VRDEPINARVEAYHRAKTNLTVYLGVGLLNKTFSAAGVADRLNELDQAVLGLARVVWEESDDLFREDIELLLQGGVKVLGPMLVGMADQIVEALRSTSEGAETGEEAG